MRDDKDHIRVLLYYTTITGWGVLLRHSFPNAWVLLKNGLLGPASGDAKPSAWLYSSCPRVAALVGGRVGGVSRGVSCKEPTLHCRWGRLLKLRGLEAKRMTNVRVVTGILAVHEKSHVAFLPAYALPFQSSKN